MLKRKIISVIISALLVCGHLTSCGQDQTDVIPSICDDPYPLEDVSISTHGSWTREHYPKRIQEFKQDPVRPGDIVMLGNSLTEQGGDWSVRLGVQEVVNRGISGDTAEGVVARLDELICKAPSKVFLMIGTNNLWTDKSTAQIHNQIIWIAERLANEIDDVEIYVQTIMPLAKDHEKSEKLAKINALIRQSSPSNYKVIDTHAALSDDNGSLSPELTTDGVHLTEKGYSKWSEFLKMNI